MTFRNNPELGHVTVAMDTISRLLLLPALPQPPGIVRVREQALTSTW